ncbi:MAG TPA: YIP1 family protein [Paenibacillus sp.]|uniref:YIP1 family protein n=1 Tax=Paenibacillus sp. TaxID=58172 RepID=UPI0028D0FF07|nr:YIP1 family protein [Paenibacillus sp.]HUC90752.1 YIP1 family protein [Paenibacillus sp.]
MTLHNPFRGGINLIQCLLHPFNSFYAIKEEGKGSLAQAGLIVLVFFFAAVLKRQNTGYAFNYNDLSELNVWLIAAKTVLLFALWVVGNWAVATWMDGEGKAVQIIIVSAYAIVPYVTAVILSTLLSNVLLAEEGVFLQYMTVVATLWSGMLMLIGLQTIHDYGFVRNLQSLALTLAAMGIIVFLGVLFYTLFQQAYVFIYTVYNELLFRL